MKKATIKTDEELGIQTINGNKYNKYGVCLDCNGWNLECLHQNLVEDGGVTKCVMCGLKING